MTGEVETTSESPGEVPGKDFCARFSKLVCEGDQGCCQDVGLRYDSQKDCEADLVARCERETLPLVQDPRTGYSEVAAGRELGRLQGFVTSCDLAMAPWFVDRDGMLSIYEGSVTQGEACTPADSEDAGAMLSCKGSVCRLTAPPLAGVCSAKGKALDTACFTHIECEEGLACSAPLGLAGLCGARKADGQRCEDGFSCKSLYCDQERCVPATENRVFCARKPSAKAVSSF